MKTAHFCRVNGCHLHRKTLFFTSLDSTPPQGRWYSSPRLGAIDGSFPAKDSRLTIPWVFFFAHLSVEHCLHNINFANKIERQKVYSKQAHLHCQQRRQGGLATYKLD